MTPAAAVQKSLAAIHTAQAEFDRAIAMATALVLQAAEQHRDGLLDDARSSAADAGDILHVWVGDSDAVSDLEEALWAGHDDGWESFMDARVGEEKE